MYVVGGQGYVGSRVIDAAIAEGTDPAVISRTGLPSLNRPSIAWPDFEARLHEQSAPPAVVWLLDGAKHAETDRLSELLAWAPTDAHVTLVSTCTVYGDRHGSLCTEQTPLDLVTPHARVKAECERMLADSALNWCVLRLGALYGVDDRGVRLDRIAKWVTQSARDHVVTVPDPDHWRGWLHRDQAARALVRASLQRLTGTFNVASSNMTFADAVSTAAGLFDARVEGAAEADPSDYKVDSSLAVERGLLDERSGEDLPTCTRAFAAKHVRSPINHS
jgi:nucleoside-diphosphate-sugar epimerase